MLFSSGATAEVKEPKLVRGWEQGKYGGTLTIAMLAEPKTFNRIIAKETASTDLLGFVFEGLVESNGVTAEIEPALAKSWEYSKDGKVWTFHLRQGVQWHDGVELTAADVIFTLDVIFDDRVPNVIKDLLLVDGCPLRYRQVDKYTVEFTLPKPFAPMLQSMQFPIMPKHLLVDAWRNGVLAQTWHVGTPPAKIVGTGPYKLSQYVPGQHVVLQRNANYWKVDSKGMRLPYLDRLVLRFVENKDTQALLFLQGGIDIYTVRGAEYGRFQSEASKGGYRIFNAGPDSGTLFLAFNQNSRFVQQPQLSWFTNQRFRQAVAHAVDKVAITNAAFGGHAVPQWAFESVAKGLQSNPHVRQYPYDLHKSQAILQEAGFSKGADGLLRDNQGHKVEFTLVTNAGSKQREVVAAIIAEDLRKLGMQVTYAPLDFSLLVNRMYSGADWQCMLMGLSGGSPEPNNEAGIWRSDGKLHLWNVGNAQPQTAWEARVDELFDTGAVTMDPQSRRRIYYEAQEIIADQVPVIFTVAQTVYVAARNHLGNVKPTSLGGSLHNVEVIFDRR